MDYPIIKHNTTQKINDLNYTNRLNEIYRFIKNRHLPFSSHCSEINYQLSRSKVRVLPVFILNFLLMLLAVLFENLFR